MLSLGLTHGAVHAAAQFIIFILGWPLEWTEIIVIFMPIFIPLLPQVQRRPAVLRPAGGAEPADGVPVAAGGDGGVLPEGRRRQHVTLNQIFAGMMPFMGIQVLALALLYIFPAIGLWLPNTLYK